MTALWDTAWMGSRRRLGDGRLGQRRDWKRRYPRRHLDGSELVGAINHYILDVRRAEHVLRQYLVEHGMEPEATMAHADHGLIPEHAGLPDGGGYWFHGAGAVIKIPGQPAVDVDWNREGETVIDAFKITPWLEGHGVIEPDAKRTATAMQALAAEGSLRATTYWAGFIAEEMSESAPSDGVA